MTIKSKTTSKNTKKNFNLDNKRNYLLRGYIGETYVMYRLAKMGIRSQMVLSHNGYDILLDNGIKLEIKTASLRIRKDKRRPIQTKRRCWQFSSQKVVWTYEGESSYHRKLIKNEGNSDFFILVCLDETGDDVIKEFIVPTNKIVNRFGASIPEDFSNKSTNSLKKYEDKWELLE